MNAPKDQKLSIVVPVFNEEDSVREIIGRLMRVEFPIPSEVIAVDDGSTDGSAELLQELRATHGERLRVFTANRNLGKGAALRIGFHQAMGTILTIQDADLEYEPQEFNELLALILAGEADVVYGSRYLSKANRVSLANRLGNGFLSLMTSVLYGAWISDMETCYKMFRKELLSEFNLRSTGFEIEPELTAKLLRSGRRIREHPISYQPRSKKSGKKINYIRDGWHALLCLLKYRITRGGAGPWPIEELIASVNPVTDAPPPTL